MTKASIPAQIARLQKMSVPELREEWKRLYDGEEPRVSNRVWLWKRLAWRVQELKYGGLSDTALQRLEELMPTAELELRNPPGKKQPPPAPIEPVRDKRIPPPGTVLLRRYKGQAITVEVLANGFEWEGRQFRSLSAVAKEVTGSHLNGIRFFHLDRKETKK